MSDTQGWIAPADAAKLANRHVSRIYRWVQDGAVQARRDDRGRMEVSGADVLKAEAQSKPGRPKGSARVGR